METTSPPAEGDSYDEYDATLDADASLVDWAAVPLVNEPPISSQAQTPENGIPGRNSSPDTSDEYGEDVYDDAFLAQLTQLEANGMSIAYCDTFLIETWVSIPIVLAEGTHHRVCSVQSNSTSSQCWAP